MIESIKDAFGPADQEDRQPQAKRACDEAGSGVTEAPEPTPPRHACAKPHEAEPKGKHQQIPMPYRASILRFHHAIGREESGQDPFVPEQTRRQQQYAEAHQELLPSGP